MYAILAAGDYDQSVNIVVSDITVVLSLQGIKAAMNAFANVSKNGVTDEDVVRGK